MMDTILSAAGHSDGAQWMLEIGEEDVYLVEAVNG